MTYGEVRRSVGAVRRIGSDRASLHTFFHHLSFAATAGCYSFKQFCIKNYGADIDKKSLSERDICTKFITPPRVHSMVLTLERRGFIRRVPGQARSITLIIPSESLPTLRPSKAKPFNP